MGERPTPTQAEINKSHEAESSDQFVGLHARLLLADNQLFNPDKDVPQARKHIKKLFQRKRL